MSPHQPLCAQAIYRFVGALPAGTEGSLLLSSHLTTEQRYVVGIRFEPSPGSLPFPLWTEDAFQSVLAKSQDYSGLVEAARSPGSIQLSFAAPGGGASIA